MKRLLSMLLLLAMIIAIVPVSDAEAASKKKKDADTITVSLAGYKDHNISYEEETLIKDKDGAYRKEYNDEEGKPYAYLEVWFSDDTKIDGKLISGDVITRYVIYKDAWNKYIGGQVLYNEEPVWADADIAQTLTMTNYKKGKVVSATRYDIEASHYDYDTGKYIMDCDVNEYHSMCNWDCPASYTVVKKNVYCKSSSYFLTGIYTMYKNGKSVNGVWFREYENYTLGSDIAIKLYDQSKKTFKKKCKTVDDYRYFKKNINKYVGKQYKLQNMYVIQIEEYYNYTWMKVSNSDGIYDLLIDGTNDILEGDYINAWVAITGAGYYETISGDQRFTVYGLCKAVEKVK